MRPAAFVVNRALASENWARERLAAHAGRKLRVAVGPAAMTLAVEADGSFADTEGTPDLTLTIPPLRLPSLMANPERWNEMVVASGDPGLAATIGELAQTLPWFVERALARVFGPVIGAPLAEAGRRLLALPGYASDRVAASFASYAREEAGLVTGVREAGDFSGQVASLAARVDALGERIDRLPAATAAKKQR
jgi:ubiquinone biosynthesis protein UbiJ